jgi:hypothetical protein
LRRKETRVMSVLIRVSSPTLSRPRSTEWGGHRTHP